MTQEVLFAPSRELKGSERDLLSVLPAGNEPSRAFLGDPVPASPSGGAWLWNGLTEPLGWGAGFDGDPGGFQGRRAGPAGNARPGAEVLNVRTESGKHGACLQCICWHSCKPSRWFFVG